MKFFQFFLLLLLLAVLCGLCSRRERTDDRLSPVRDTVTVFDTVTVPRDSLVQRDTLIVSSLAVTLPVADGTRPDSVCPDSAKVTLPITSHTYGGNGWRAVVSGFRPRLDSLVLFTERQTVTVSRPALSGGNAVRRRWWQPSVGVQAGVGLTPRGVQPYVGVGATWEF